MGAKITNSPQTTNILPNKKAPSNEIGQGMHGIEMIEK